MTCAPAEARTAFRLGVRERNGRERGEDGADDHNHERQTWSLCRTFTRAAQSPHGAAVSGVRDAEIFNVEFRCFRENILSEPCDATISLDA